MVVTVMGALISYSASSGSVSLFIHRGNHSCPAYLRGLLCVSNYINYIKHLVIVNRKEEMGNNEGKIIYEVI